jgi:hypothetical protein
MRLKFFCDALLLEGTFLVVFVQSATKMIYLVFWIYFVIFYYNSIWHSTNLLKFDCWIFINLKFIL